MTESLGIQDFLGSSFPLLDVRSPGEFGDGHIGSAINLPLLSDTHRVQVGIAYKKQGREAAIELGYRLVNPLRDQLLGEAARIAPGKEIRLYCARGGLRSGNMARFFSENGYKVQVLRGGYKAYRNHILKVCGSFRNIIIISGYTGSGKTEILKAIGDQGAQVLDLEGLAHHKGSAFGSLGYEAQPKSAVFHNRIFEALQGLDPEKPLWVENESHTIGRVFLPPVLWENMKAARGVEIELPREERLQFTIRQYGHFSPAELNACVRNLGRRLGDEETRRLCALIEEGRLEPAVESLFRYYDKAYEFGRSKRISHSYVKISFPQLDPEAIARYLISVQDAIVKQFN